MFTQKLIALLVGLGVLAQPGFARADVNQSYRDAIRDWKAEHYRNVFDNHEDLVLKPSVALLSGGLIAKILLGTTAVAPVGLTLGGINAGNEMAKRTLEERRLHELERAARVAHLVTSHAHAQPNPYADPDFLALLAEARKGDPSFGDNDLMMLLGLIFDGPLGQNGQSVLGFDELKVTTRILAKSGYTDAQIARPEIQTRAHGAE